jgi:hypothetical protein
MKLIFSKNFYCGNCLGVINVVTIVLLLAVSISGFFIFGNWYNNFLPTVEDDNFGTYSFSEEYVEFLRVNNKSGNYSLVVRNKLFDKFNITEVKVQGVLCPVISNSIIYGNSITTINLSCVNFDKVSRILVITEFGVVVSNVLVE